MHEFSRRTLLQSAATALAGRGLAGFAPAVAAGTQSQRLTTGWEYYRGNLGGAWEVWRGKAASDNVTWNAVELPHCFNARDAVDPDEHYYQGPGWYRTHLKAANPYPNGRTLLHFEGAGQRSTVYVGQKMVGEHVGGYDEWTVDITEAAAGMKTVPVAILCDNSRNLEMIPSDLSDFNRYGGLYRYVNLVYVPENSIERVHVMTGFTPAGKAWVTVRPRLRSRLPSITGMSARIFDPFGKLLREGESVEIEKPVLWSPSIPALYRCEVQWGEQTVTERFGLRHFEFVKHGPFKLNGERLLLRGTHRHEDHAGLAAAMTEDLIKKEMGMIKAMGANFIRLGHYQQSRIVLDQCDELGLLVWEEIPWCRGGVGGAAYQEQARRMLRNMIDQHRNHPSVILWGLGNENDWPGDFETFDKDGIRKLMTELNTIAHELDPSRKTVIRRCDFAADIPDVYSPSIWAGWYRGKYIEYKSSTEKEMKKVNYFFHAEWGGDSEARRHSEDPDKGLAAISTGAGTDERGLDYLLTGGQARASRDGDWSESYICNLFDWHLKEQETMPWLTGAAQWAFKDFSTPLRPEDPVPRMNQKGLVERDLTPKEGYYVFQSYWTEKPMAHIYGHSWPIRWGAHDEKKLVKVYSNCPSAELFLNGKSCGVKERNSQNFPAAGLRWEVQFREGENHVRVVARKNGADVSDEVRFRYQTAKWGKPAKLALAEVERAGDRVTVEARLYDASGVQCLDARDFVRFGLAGDGRLLDNLGTSTGSRLVGMYNGRALISLLRNGGASTVSVQAKGTGTAFLKVG
jgi:beta-galactosidase